MPTELEQTYLEGMTTSIAEFIRSWPAESAPFLISAASECLKKRLPMNEAEILGTCRRIRYQSRATA